MSMGGLLPIMVRPTGVKSRSGGPNSPRLPNGNINWEQVYKEYLSKIIADQKAPNTVRGFMYILKSKGVLSKSDAGTLDKHLVEWRLDGVISWDDIADGSGRGLVGDFDEFEPLDDFLDTRVDTLKNAGEAYRLWLNEEWRWFGQPNYVGFMAEKQAVTGTKYAYIKDKYVKTSYNRGNNSWGWAYKYAEKLRRELYYTDINTGERKPRNVYIWYLGDDDNYGKNMDRQLRGQLSEFKILDKITFKRIAVLPEQAEEYHLPRSDEGGGYDIDALNAYDPERFERLLLEHIDPYFDEDIHNMVLEEYSVKSIDELLNEKWKGYE